MNKGTRSILISLSVLLFMNTGFQSTVQHEPPAVNFRGTINNEKFTNLTISGLYENIPLYEKPFVLETAPTANVAHIRLDDIKSIKNILGKEGIKEYQKREYVEIEVEFKDGKKHPYLVERARKIYYEVPFSDPAIKPLEKEVLFEAIKDITITGAEQRPRGQQEPSTKQEKSPARDAVCIQAREHIKDLEKESKGTFDTVINNIKEAVNYLCT